MGEFPLHVPLIPADVHSVVAAGLVSSNKIQTKQEVFSKQAENNVGVATYKLRDDTLTQT